MLRREHWHVLGAGAIGCLVSEALLAQGCEVTLLLRGANCETTGQLRVVRNGAEQHTAITCEAANAAGKIDKLLITTKAYDVLPAVQSIAPRLGDTSEVVLLVNGMGIAQGLATALPGATLYLGTTTEGAYRNGPLQIQHAGRGITRIGRQDQAQAPHWFTPWADSHLQCQWDSSIDSALWSKLAVNCVINPLSAVHHCLNGELASRPELATEVERLCREVMQVSYAAGFTRTAQTLTQTVHQVITGTAANRSSMLQDVENGRRTEIDFITGHLLAVAEQHAIVAPHNRELFERIKNLE